MTTLLKNKTAIRVFWLSLIALGIVGTLLYTPAQPQNMSLAPEVSQSPTPVATSRPTPRPIVLNKQITAPATDTKFVTIRVQPDQTLWQIARKHCGSHRYIESIARYNGIADVRKVRAGSSLTIICALK